MANRHASLPLRATVAALGVVPCLLAQQRGSTPVCPPLSQPAASLAPAAVVKGDDAAESSARIRRRQRLRLLESSRRSDEQTAAAAATLARSGVDRVLVILVEFGGPDALTWTAGSSRWDPLGKGDPAEVVYDANGRPVIGDCSRIISETRQFSYSGPLHNEIERPRSAGDPSGRAIWTPDFDRTYYEDLAFGDGVALRYERQDGSEVHQDFSGHSVRDYYEDMSGGMYSFAGDILGWVRLPHSSFWYGADLCPGRKSLPNSKIIPSAAAIPDAGTHRSFVIDALQAARATYPDLDWSRYDLDGDGVIDRLWIIHAGLGEEDDVSLLNRTSYGEGALWSHSSQLLPAFEVVPGVAAGPYILMPENTGISVLAHEFGHNLGADDLYSYAGGFTSAGFWTLMADARVGFPVGMVPAAIDPWHLDGWGWLHPTVITDPSREHIVTLGQASRFPGGEDVVRAAKIRLPDQVVPLPVAPSGAFQWWGGSEAFLNASMTTRQPIAIPASGATLDVSLAFDLEQWYDYLWVQVSTDGGATWATLTSWATTCGHAPDWIGARYGFPDDLCAAGIGGLTGRSLGFPSLATHSFSLDRFAGRSILLRFWYMTDNAVEGLGPFVDDVLVSSRGVVLFRDDAESGPGRWSYADGWDRVRSTRLVSHSLYLQWRNTSPTGGYDATLGDARGPYGPAPSGLLVWYNNNLYTDNEIPKYLTDGPSFGPKGRMLLFDAHPEPYRDAVKVALGFPNEAANLLHRAQMRDAPFSLRGAPAFVFEGASYPGRPGVSAFVDALGYYPGAELVSAGPGYSPPRTIWATRQWDASAVMPSRVPYGIRAPGMGATDPLSYGCVSQPDGTLRCTTLGSGLGTHGASGNPGDVGGAHGWHAEILSESDTAATVRIWNTATHCRLVCEPKVPARVPHGVEVRLEAEVTASGCSQPVLYEWELGDDSPRSTLVAPTHTYANDGRYAWKLLASSGAAACEASGRIEVFSARASRVRRHLEPPPD